MKIMLIGASAAGKTTLIQRLQDMELKYDKTQAVEYVGNFIDTPGEYMQNRWFWGPLTVTSYDADIIGLVHDSTDEDCWFNGGLASKFDKPVIGIVTKIDQEDSKPSRSRNYLEFAGVKEIFETSAVDGSGIEALSEGFHRILEKK
ncbi:MAG: EutP/PduV family microcompartment system protein [Lachnospiraceae bacterium]|nr:EutP/PduV family microcompartment system protein [Lachnospiraceae bacterium]